MSMKPEMLYAAFFLTGIYCFNSDTFTKAKFTPVKLYLVTMHTSNLFLAKVPSCSLNGCDASN